MKWAKRNDEFVVPLRKDESVEAELKAPGGDWQWNWERGVPLT